MDDFNKSVFDQYLNTNFIVKISEDQELALELIETKEVKMECFDAFTLILKGTSNMELFDNTYTFQHENLGEISMFISPYKRTAEHVYYDIQFTREKGTSSLTV